jgi:ubiquinone/menaquinone biosynthesis C-methylase UbiE
MNNDSKSIHEFDFNLICEYFSSLERQGPGSPEVTVKALSFIDNLSDKSCIADIGCGSGGQTMVLAQHTAGRLTGVDLFPLFIELFNQNATLLGLQDRVQGVVESKRFLKTGGFIAVTEVSWFTEERPSEINDFWLDAYPEIDTIPRKVAQMQQTGYLPVATFVLPENCWTEHFYAPQAIAQENFLKKYAGNSTVESLIASQRHEAQLFDKYKAYYGYVFYIGKKL